MNLSNVFLVQLPTFFLKLLATIPVAPVITGIIVHFRFHIRCISIHKLLYFNFFSASFLHDISVYGYYHIYQCACFIFLFLIIISGLFAVTSIIIIIIIIMFVLKTDKVQDEADRRCAG